jgi:hypothetical protein
MKLFHNNTEENYLNKYVNLQVHDLLNKFEKWFSLLSEYWYILSYEMNLVQYKNN